MPADHHLSDTACPHVEAWMLAPPRVPSPIDEGALLRISMALGEIGATAARAGWAAEYSAALLKMLAATNAAPAVDHDEDAIFAVSQRLREAFYLEIMSYRRAAQADVDMGALRA